MQILTRLGLKKPEPADGVPGLRTAIADNADKVADAAIHLRGARADRPASAVDGTHYRCDDTRTIFLWEDTAWEPWGAAPGDVIFTMSSTARAGWRTLDGSAVTLAADPDLFAILGAIGNPWTTVGAEIAAGIRRLPALNGHSLAAAGAGHSLGSLVGQDFKTITADNLPDHDHIVSGTATGLVQPRAGGVQAGAYNQYAANPPTKAVDGWTEGATVPISGTAAGDYANVPFEVRAPTVYLRALVKR